MTNEEYLRKKGTLDDLKKLVESDGYQILESEIKRLRDEGARDCCNVKLTSAERDAGAGAHNMGDALLEFVKQKIKALQSSLGREKIARSTKRAQQ